MVLGSVYFLIVDDRLRIKIDNDKFNDENIIKSI